MSLTVTILGCNSSLPTSEKFSTAQLINFNERYFLIDCAEGTQMQLRKVHAKFSRINQIFISHLHGDHYFGLFGLISSFNLLGRKQTLTVYGPPQLQKILNFHAEHMERNLNFKINFVNTATKDKKLLFEDRSIEIYSFPLYHRIECYGFLFVEKKKPYNIIKDSIEKHGLSIKEIVDAKSGKDIIREHEIIANSLVVSSPPSSLSYAFCSDTAYDKRVAQSVTGVKVLYHESTFLNNMKARAVATKHSTAEEAAQIAKEAAVETLILGHFSSRYTEYDAFLQEASIVFQNVLIAGDEKVFKFQ